MTLLDELLARRNAVALEDIPAGTNGQVLTTVAGAAAWAAPTGGGGGAGVASLQGLTGAITIGTDGGIAASTDASTLFLSFFLPNQAQGDLAYYTGTAWARLPAGTAGRVLTMAGGVPTWSVAPAGATPTGTGFVRVTAGAQEAAAKLVENGDVATNAAIAVAKLAPATTAGFVLTTSGGVATWAAPASAGVASLGIGSSTLTGAITLTAGANVTLTPVGNNVTIAATGGGGGATPTGTGFRYVAAGVEAAAAKLVENADIAANANIAVSKLAPASTNGHVLTTSGGVAVWAAPAAGAVPSGTGVRTVVGGTETVRKIVNTDVDDAAAIAPAKLSSGNRAGHVLGRYDRRTSGGDAVAVANAWGPPGAVAIVDVNDNAGAQQDVTLFTAPAGSRFVILGVYAVLTSIWGGSTTIAVRAGKTVGGEEYLKAQTLTTADTAFGKTLGRAAAEKGSAIPIDGSDGDDLAAGGVVTARFTPTGASIGASVRFYVIAQVFA